MFYFKSPETKGDSYNTCKPMDPRGEKYIANRALWPFVPLHTEKGRFFTKFSVLEPTKGKAPEDSFRIKPQQKT